MSKDEDPIAEAFKRRKVKQNAALGLASDPVEEAFEKRRVATEGPPSFADFARESHRRLIAGEPQQSWAKEMKKGKGGAGASWVEALHAILPTTTMGNIATGALTGDWAALERQGAFLGGVEAGAAGHVLESGAGLAGFPTSFIGMRTNKAADFLSRAAHGLYNSQEKAARAAGLTDEEIQSSYNVGGFIGMIVPIVASIKLASAISGTGMMANDVAMLSRAVPELAGHPGIKLWAQRGPLITDWVAGAIYGGVFREGDAEQRLKNMTLESGLWGAGRVVLNTMTQPVVAWRQRRAYELDATGRLSTYLDDVENGRPHTPVSREEMARVFELIEGETFIMHSAAAQEMLARGEGDVALMQAIKDLADRRGSGGVFKNLGGTFEEATARIERFRQKFPGLKFSTPIKRSKGVRPSTALEGGIGPAEGVEEFAYDVYFGTQGISSKKLSQLKHEGRFEGQIVHYKGSVEYEYVGKQMLNKKGKPTKLVEGKVWIRANKEADPRFVKADNLTDTPFAREELDEATRKALFPKWDTLYRDYEAFVIEKSREVASQRGSVAELDLIAAARQGKLDLADDGRRVFNSAGAIIHPEEAGILGEEAILAINMVDPQSPGSSLIITRSAKSGGQWQATALEDVNATGKPNAVMGDQSFNSLDDAIAWAESDGWTVQAATKKYPSGGEVTQQIAQEGTSRAGILQAPPVLGFDDMVDFWAEARGLPKDASDYVAMKDWFRSRLRRWGWEQVPAEERALFDRALAEQAAMIDAGDLPLEVLAHEKGFSMQRLPTGQILARQIDTGLPVMFGGERTAREGFQKILRPEVDIPSILPMGAEGLHAFTGGFPIQDLYHFGDAIQSLDFVRDLPTARMRNLRDILYKVENQVGGWPIATEGLDRVLQGRDRFMNAMFPHAKVLEDIWNKGVPSRARRYELVDAWVEGEGLGYTRAETARLMQERGFTPKEISSYTRAQILWDRWFVEVTDIDPVRFRQSYYTRVRPFLEEHPGVDIRAILELDPLSTPAENLFWAEMQRTGNLMSFEKDPALVMHKYIRSAMWEKYMKEPWDRMAALSGTTSYPALRIRDLDVAQQQRIMAQAMPGTTEDSFVVPEPLRKLIENFLVSIRGSPTAAEKTTRDWVSNIFHRIGIKARPEVVEDLIGLHMSTMYGAAMGLKPSMVARNLMGQHLWNQYTRTGPKWLGPGIDVAGTYQGFDEALAEGVFHWSEGGIPYGDLLTKQMRDEGVFGEKGVLSHVGAQTIRGMLAAGTISRDLARTMLVPYQSAEQHARSMVYHTQKLHTTEWLGKWEGRKISYDKFVEEGLSFFDPATQTRFRQIYDLEGRERALRYIGRQASDEANFLYISGMQPLWMQKPLVRPFAMFGTFTIWQWELYLNRMRNGTARQQAQFIARNAILVAGFANMSYQTGVNMTNWMAPSSLGWFGGPDLQTLFNLHKVVTAPVDEKASAIKRLVDQGTSLAFPGQGFLRDLNAAGEVPEPARAIYSMFAGRVNYNENWAINNLFDPGQARKLGERAVIDPAVAEQIFHVPPAVFNFGEGETRGLSKEVKERIRLSAPRVTPVEPEEDEL